ncbi:MAG: hypothetical protein ACXAEN_26330, partial [Candidatus Thorarchaeota archaeon]
EGFICQAFKNMSPQDVKGLSQQRQLEYLARAEMLLGTPFELEDKKRRRRPPMPPPGYESVGGDLTAEADRITSREAADIPDFRKDNAELRDL